MFVFPNVNIIVFECTYMLCLLENIVFMIANIHKYTLIINIYIFHFKLKSQIKYIVNIIDNDFVKNCNDQFKIPST